MLEDKTLVMIVGPVAVGKSWLMNEVVSQNNQFGRVSGFTTRQPRNNDEPGLYRYLSVDQANVIISANDCVQYAVHPTTGAIYGTQFIDYPKPFNVLDTLSNVAEQLRNLPFKQSVAISVTTDATAWEQWLLKRYPTASDERTKRLKEAILSIEWSLNQTSNHHWLVNRPEQLTQTADQLITIVESALATTPVPPEAAKLLLKAKSLLS